MAHNKQKGFWLSQYGSAAGGTVLNEKTISGGAKAGLYILDTAGKILTATESKISGLRGFSASVIKSGGSKIAPVRSLVANIGIIATSTLECGRFSVTSKLTGGIAHISSSVARLLAFGKTLLAEIAGSGLILRLSSISKIGESNNSVLLTRSVQAVKFGFSSASNSIVRAVSNIISGSVKLTGYTNYGLQFLKTILGGMKTGLSILRANSNTITSSSKISGYSPRGAYRNIAGTIEPLNSIARSTTNTITSLASTAGAIVRTIGNILSAVVDLSGLLLKGNQLSKILSAGADIGNNLLRQASVAKESTSSLAGAISRGVFKFATIAIKSSGAKVVYVTKAMSNVIQPYIETVNSTARTLYKQVAVYGLVDRLFAFTKVIVGYIDNSLSLLKGSYKIVYGNLSLGGAINILRGLVLSVESSIQGTLPRTISVEKSLGAIASGALTRISQVIKSSAIKLSGSIIRGALATKDIVGYVDNSAILIRDSVKYMGSQIKVGLEDIHKAAVKVVPGYIQLVVTVPRAVSRELIISTAKISGAVLKSTARVLGVALVSVESLLSKLFSGAILHPIINLLGTFITRIGLLGEHISRFDKEGRF